MPSTGYNLGPAFGSQTGPLSTGALDTAFAQPQSVLNTLSNFSNYFVDTSGAANSITVAVPSPLVFAYTDGVQLQVRLANANTSPTVTINVNGLGSKSVVLVDGQTPGVGQLIANSTLSLLYDGTVFRIMSSSGARLGTGLFSDGAVATPSMAFAIEPSTGWWRSATNEMSASIGGTKRVSMDSGILGLMVIGAALSVTDGIATPVTTGGVAKIYVDVADGDLKIRFGDGTVKTIVTDT